MPELDYYGVRPCGCATAWMSAKSATKKEVRAFERTMAETGRTVERGPFDLERIHSGFVCSHDIPSLIDENRRLRERVAALERNESTS
jgi:pyridoxine/pyridoxamine 5'-phosphate oxidase